MRLLTMLALAVISAGAWCGKVQAQNFPNRPITLIIPWTPGGGTMEVHLRVLAKQAEAILGQSITIDFKPGAAGTLGPATVGTAKPDGYTIGSFPVTVFRQPAMAKVSYDPAKDFTYIIHLTGYLLGVAVPTDSGWKSWADLVAAAKKRDVPLSFAHSGVGSTPHLAIEAMAEWSGIKVRQVPFRSQGEMTAALLGKHVDFMGFSGGAKAQLDAGEIQLVAIWTKDRSTTYPSAPTLYDLGMNRSFASPYGLAGPKGIDPKVVKILHDALKTAFYSPEHQAAMKQLDHPDMYMNSEDYTAFAMQQIREERQMVEKLGLALKQ